MSKWHSIETVPRLEKRLKFDFKRSDDEVFKECFWQGSRGRLNWWCVSIGQELDDHYIVKCFKEWRISDPLQFEKVERLLTEDIKHFKVKLDNESNPRLTQIYTEKLNELLEDLTYNQELKAMYSEWLD